MRKTTLAFALLLAISLIPITLHAQTPDTCDSVCQPYSDCTQNCYYCDAWDERGAGNCEHWGSTTCGAWTGACTDENCVSNWQETSRTNVGTYGEGSFFCWWGSGCTYSCAHHRVDEVTFTDLNQCKTDPAYWTQTVCTDTIDGTKGPSSHSEDCCSGFNQFFQLDPTFTCNHYHSCS